MAAIRREETRTVHSPPHSRAIVPPALTQPNEPKSIAAHEQERKVETATRNGACGALPSHIEAACSQHYGRWATPTATRLSRDLRNHEQHDRLDVTLPRSSQHEPIRSPGILEHNDVRKSAPAHGPAEHGPARPNAASKHATWRSTSRSARPTHVHVASDAKLAPP